MEPKTFTLLMGCGLTRTTLTLKQHTPRVDLWYANKIRGLTVKPENITGIIVGPGLVVELFSDDHFTHMTDTIENATHPPGHKYEIGCYDDHPIFKGVIRSFKVWDYDAYHENGTLIKYCDNDKDCQSSELCLCPGGDQPGTPIT